MRFLVDAQLPPALASWVIRQGHMAEHVFERLGPAATDSQILAHAVATNSTLITKNAGFIDLVSGDARVFWVRLGNTVNAALLAAFEAHFAAALRELDSGARVVSLGN